MKKWNSLSLNQQKEVLICTNIFLFFTLFGVIFIALKMSIYLIFWTFYLAILGLLDFAYLIYRKKAIFNKITTIKELLDIPLTEMRMVIQGTRFDLMDWNYKNTPISRKNLFKLEEYMEDRYFLAFHERYQKKVAEQKLAEKQAVEKALTEIVE
ncbi:hypothetical protein [Enterococcus cecorum]|uniref:Uncharacterized protein n=1 Tax=Enterococcus cecorum TaxID=44008 RepID=A0A366SFA1_9ENTE|nr:hypothetical protein [Enterococcus cecorum]RBR28930.1 hypothetical protein EB18_01547 [Enterococcus cecorum]